MLEQGEERLNLTTSETRAVETIGEYVNVPDLRLTIETCIVVNRERKLFNKLVRQINKEAREGGSVSVATINEFTKFYSDIKKHAETDEAPEITSQKTILFYAPAEL